MDTSVSMVVVPCRALVQAAWWKLRPSHSTTTLESTSATHCQAGNCSAGTMDTTTTGMLSAKDHSTRGLSAAASSAFSASGTGSVAP